MKHPRGFLHGRRWRMFHGLLKFALGPPTRVGCDTNSSRWCQLNSWYGLWMRVKAPHNHMVMALGSCAKWLLALGWCTPSVEKIESIFLLLHYIGSPLQIYQYSTWVSYCAPYNNEHTHGGCPELCNQLIWNLNIHDFLIGLAACMLHGARHQRGKLLHSPKNVGLDSRWTTKPTSNLPFSSIEKDQKL